MGDPSREGDHIGPLFDQIQYQRVQAMIQTGIDEGARLLAGGLGRPDGFESGWYVKPTVFCDVRPEMRIYREEIFGPVLVISAFNSEEEAIAMANDTDYGLAAYIQTGDEARALRVARRLRAGGIHINGVSPDYGSPFGGYKHSGNGREGGLLGLEDFYEIKVRPLPPLIHMQMAARICRAALGCHERSLAVLVRVRLPAVTLPPNGPWEPPHILALRVHHRPFRVENRARAHPDQWRLRGGE